MSQENVEIVRAWLEAWNAGDFDAWAEFLAPNVIMLPVEGWPEPGPFAGREAVVRQFLQQREAWDAEAVEPISDFIDAADRVVLRFIWHAAGHGPAANFDVTGVFTVRKGKVLIIEFFWDQAEALEAVGLSEQAKSKENVEIVRSICAAWERGDYSSTEWADPDIELVFSDGPAPGNAKGLAGMAAAWREFLNAWDEFHQQAEGYLELDDERVLVSFRFSGRGKTSGMDLGQMGSKGAGLFHIREGKVIRFAGYLDREHALADLGLSE
jgi:ketosteroid isomerase-like protein